VKTSIRTLPELAEYRAAWRENVLREVRRILGSYPRGHIIPEERHLLRALSEFEPELSFYVYRVELRRDQAEPEIRRSVERRWERILALADVAENAAAAVFAASGSNQSGGEAAR